MKITTTQADGKTVIKIEGDLRLPTVAEAKPEIVAALAKGEDIQLDLGEVGECDTAGMQLLLMVRASAHAQGKRLAITARSAAFLLAVEHAGIPVGCFEFREGTF